MIKRMCNISICMNVRIENLMRIPRDTPTGYSKPFHIVTKIRRKASSMVSSVMNRSMMMIDVLVMCSLMMVDVMAYMLGICVMEMCSMVNILVVMDMCSMVNIGIMEMCSFVLGAMCYKIGDLCLRIEIHRS